MIGLLRALAAVVVAALEWAVTAARTSWHRATTADDDAAALAYEADVARTVGYRGPVDAQGRWLDDLAAGRIDHDGQQKAKKPCGCGRGTRRSGEGGS
mgnify:CR=1 FL=1